MKLYYHNIVLIQIIVVLKYEMISVILYYTKIVLVYF